MPSESSITNATTSTSGQALGPAPGSPGNRYEGDDLAPSFQLVVNELPINQDVNKMITQVQYESALGMADMLKVSIDNPGLIDPDSPYPDWNGHKAFQPGNQVSLYIAYGNTFKNANYVGRVFWTKHMPEFPKEGMPKLEAVGYDLSHSLMDKEGPIVNAGNYRINPKTAQPIGKVDDQGQVLTNVLHSDIVANIAGKYNMDADIDATTVRENIIIKKGRKHYELIRGLANINNRDFWVDYNIVTKRWVLHWKIQDRSQAAQYTFRYAKNKAKVPENTPTSGTLLNVSPEYGLRETISTATVSFFDSKLQEWVSAIQIEDVTGPNPVYQPGGGLAQRGAVARRPLPPLPGKPSTRPRAESRATVLKAQAHDVITEALDNATAFSIAAGGINIDISPSVLGGNRFKTPQEAADACLRWFLGKQNNFITVKGTLVGVETLRARQTHYLKGIGERLSGAYFFTRVNHIVGADNYMVDFTANRVIGA